jgi:hypothetical protein
VAGHTGTIVKTRYSRGLKAALLLAKGHVRYAVHRCNEQGQRQYREVWDRDGSISKLGAYERIDRVHKDDYVYRLMLSPHPEHQDAARQIDLKEWTHQMMRQLEQDFGRRVDWFAVSHEHPEHRPVHVVAVSKQRLGVDQFRSIREAGDGNVLSQQREQTRRQLDREGERPSGSARAHGRDRDVAGHAARQRPTDGRDVRAPRRTGPLFNGDWR